MKPAPKRPLTWPEIVALVAYGVLALYSLFAIFTGHGPKQ